ncbi:MAG: hypothetical protein E6Q97_37340 [Desulfurellales bacterium]|nr:MAG: hypothetical protein E6Q97_37340 [Desulfurellales bacterium]
MREEAAEEFTIRALRQLPARPGETFEVRPDWARRGGIPMTDTLKQPVETHLCKECERPIQFEGLCSKCEGE